MSFKMLIFVAAGGAVGAVGRFVMMSQIGHSMGGGFPWGTLAVNVLGSFLLGVFVELSALVWSPSPEMRALIVVGILGGLTTFSTFALDVHVLSGRGDLALAWLYMAVSIVIGVGALFAGLALMRTILT